MNKSTRWFLLSVLGAAALAHLLLFIPVPHLIQALAAIALTGLLPGALLSEALVGESDSPPTPWERILYAIAAGYAVTVMVMLGLSFLPGPLARWQTLVAFDLLMLILGSLIAWQAARFAHQGRSPVIISDACLFPDIGALAEWRAWFIVGALTLLLVGGFFRFTNLGYAEYQGDEARAALRAAAVIQGYDDVLLIHKKGPTEILLPTAIYSLTGHLTETSARLPFTIANLAGLFAVFLLGWRLADPLVGWGAAMFLALDGYFIGFSRIVQYQSVVFLTTTLVVLILYRLLCKPRELTRYLTLAAILLATGLLSHYEAALAALPALFLLGVILWQRIVPWLDLFKAVVVAALAGGAMLASFYIPFITNPHFQATYTYLTDRRIGGSFPYNNLADFFLRTTVYNTIYYVLLLISLSLLALYYTYRQGIGARWAAALSLLATAMMAVTFANPEWLRFGDVDFMAVPFVFFIGLAVFMPKIQAEERMLWLWFGAVMILALFFTQKPRTHVYTFFVPWMLLVSWALARLWRRFDAWAGDQTATIVGMIMAALLIALFGSYAWWYFIQNTPEVLRTWDEWHPQGYWVPYDEPDNRALFGFPLANGWKVAGALYEKGVIQGDFETNEKEAWVPAWYTRGERRCGRTADWFFEIDNLEPWNHGDQLKMEHYLRQGFEKWGVVEINDADRMVIYKRTGVNLDDPTGAPTDNLPRFPLDEYAPYFDAQSSPDFPLTYPAVNQAISNPLHVNFGDEIWLEGYDISYETPLRPGDVIDLTLYWRAQKPLDKSYKVFNQAFYGDSGMVAQRDGYPVCNSRETWRWDPGELITDNYQVPVLDDAPDGLYPLYTGLYLEDTLERLPVLDENGNPVDTQVHLTDIRVGEE